MNIKQKYKPTILALTLLISSSFSQANPVACFNTNAGQFCIELFEADTPITTDNFLNYVNSDAYTNGIFHRSVPGFVIQGGGYKIVESSSGKTLAAVNTFPPIKNEFKISNTRGTVAMAKVGGDPNSATSQWFINLADNSGPPSQLDTQNGGFTVFGRIIFDGMNTIDAIEDLPISNINLGSNRSPAPIIGSDGSVITVENLVTINHITVTPVAGIFSQEILSFAVDIGTDVVLDVNLQLIESNPSLVFELDPASIRTLTNKPTNIATFSNSSGLLHIPSVMINATTIVNNVTMQLINADSYQFRLISYD
ncbi:peptidylprolyl isomerase [Nitrosomonas sp.]|uniref:peptidylprolyl isomerase n=1 Tax=Nitrosomonas sp. TaxID=42353 RepID=UPI001D4380E3|nr:peptidylprolyl isomerase [Nitrosomonas sp.]MBX3618194.1 peptidylprolyl isomerase [Nitrosomonas sp.]